MQLCVLIQDQRQCKPNPDKWKWCVWVFLLFVGRVSRTLKICFQTARNEAKELCCVGVESCTHKDDISRTLILVKRLSTMRHQTGRLVSGNEQTRCRWEVVPLCLLSLLANPLEMLKVQLNTVWSPRWAEPASTAWPHRFIKVQCLSGLKILNGSSLSSQENVRS